MFEIKIEQHNSYPSYGLEFIAVFSGKYYWRGKYAIFNWLEDTFGIGSRYDDSDVRWKWRPYSNHKILVIFKNQNDATAFKLKWA